MDTKTLRIAKPHFLKDKKGNAIFAVLPIDEYNQMIDIVRLYEKEEYTPNAKTIRTRDSAPESVLGKPEIRSKAFVRGGGFRRTQ